MAANDDALDGSVAMAGLLKTDPQRTRIELLNGR